LSKVNGIQLNQAMWNHIWESSPNSTIEHILPQDKSNPGWSYISETKHQEFLHSIGNLCLLAPSLNSGASNKCFDDKKEVYKKANLLMLRNIISDNNVERSVWNGDAINSRREQLIKFAVDQWKDL
jgi:hypothetical protein